MKMTKYLLWYHEMPPEHQDGSIELLKGEINIRTFFSDYMRAEFKKNEPTGLTQPSITLFTTNNTSFKVSEHLYRICYKTRHLF